MNDSYDPPERISTNCAPCMMHCSCTDRWIFLADADSVFICLSLVHSGYKVFRQNRNDQSVHGFLNMPKLEEFDFKDLKGWKVFKLLF